MSSSAKTVEHPRCPLQPPVSKTTKIFSFSSAGEVSHSPPAFNLPIAAQAEFSSHFFRLSHFSRFSFLSFSRFSHSSHFSIFSLFSLPHFSISILARPQNWLPNTERLSPLQHKRSRIHHSLRVDRANSRSGLPQCIRASRIHSILSSILSAPFMLPVYSLGLVSGLCREERKKQRQTRGRRSSNQTEEGAEEGKSR